MARRAAHATALAVCVAVVAAGLLGAADAPGDAEPDEAVDDDKPLLRAALITIEGEIDPALFTSIKGRTRRALAGDPEIVIFHITSYGGYLITGLDLSRYLERLPREGVRTVAYVDDKAISAAAMAAMACQEIVMTPEASMGDVIPIEIGPQGVKQLPEKFQTEPRQRMGHLAKKFGRDEALGKAMVTVDIVVWKVENRTTGDVRYIEGKDLFELGPDWKKVKIIDDEKTVLTVSGQRAEELGLADTLAGSVDDLYGLYNIKRPIRVYEPTLADVIVGWLNEPILRSLLVLFGMLGIYIEMTTPGFGVPGTIGVVCFGAMFVASALAGAPWVLPLLLIGAGIGFLAVELFITPGFGFMGAGGIVCLLAGIVMSLPEVSPFHEDWTNWDALLRSMLYTVGILVTFTIGALLLARLMPSVPVFRRLVLEPSQVSDGSSRAAAAPVERATQVGAVGTTAGKLRPAGKAMFGDRLVDVVTTGDFLDAGTPVRVVEARGNRIVVEPAEPIETPDEDEEQGDRFA